MTIAESILAIARFKWTNPTKDDILFTAKVMREVARDLYKVSPTPTLLKSMAEIDSYIEAINEGSQCVQAGSEAGPQGSP